MFFFSQHHDGWKPLASSFQQLLWWCNLSHFLNQLIEIDHQDSQPSIMNLDDFCSPYWWNIFIYIAISYHIYIYVYIKVIDYDQLHILMDESHPPVTSLSGPQAEAQEEVAEKSVKSIKARLLGWAGRSRCGVPWSMASRSHAAPNRNPCLKCACFYHGPVGKVVFSPPECGLYPVKMMVWEGQWYL